MKKKSIIIVAVLLIITCIATVFYLRSRNDAPAGKLAVISGNKTVLIDPFGDSLVPIKGVTISAKQREDDGGFSARLYVFGDNDSKRQVKNVVRIEIFK